MKPRYKPLSVRRQERKYKSKFIVSLVLTLALAFVLINWVLPFLIGGLSVVNRIKTGEVKKVKVEDATLAPPVLSIPYEATNSSPIQIRGYTQPNQRVEIYLDDEIKSTSTSGSDGKFVSEDIDLNLGTNDLYGKTVDDKNQSSLPSKPIKIYYDNKKPKLEVTEPTDGSISKDKKIKVSGTTDAADTTTLIIKNSRVIFNSDGNFSQTIELSDGENTIDIVATDLAGNSNQITRKVTYQPN